MEVYRQNHQIPIVRNAVLTIGSFDGVHAGHQKILQKVRQLAQKVKGESIVITFDPHPRQVVYPHDKSLQLLTTLEEKVELIRRSGIDHLVIIPFTIEFSQLTADEYIEKILVGHIHPRYIVIGSDHRFGMHRQGDINYLKWHAEKFNYDVVEIPKQDIAGIEISSTLIRNALNQGKLDQANKLLRHHYQISGKVVRGQQIGSKLGFPTANIQVQNPKKLIPVDGIYAVYVTMDDVRYKGMLYIGKKPTLAGTHDTSIEVHIFDFHENIYGKTCQLELVAKTRDDQKCENLDALRQLLIQDEIDVKLALSDKSEHPSWEELDHSIAIVILNYNGIQYLTKYLDGIIQSVKDLQGVEIFVVDNGSTDESVKYLQSVEGIHTIRHDSNLGYAAGYNQALLVIDADYYVLLNSDVEPGTNWLPPLVDILDNNPDVGAAMPKILDLKDKSKFEYAGAAGGWMDALGYPFCKGRLFNTIEKDEGQYDKTEQIFWVSGAAFIIRSKLFHGLGGFDPAYFAHQEEIDLCWRVKRAGYRVMVNHQSTVYHLGGGTLQYQSPYKLYLNFRNNYSTIFKNESKYKIFWELPIRFIMDIFSMLYLWYQGKWTMGIQVLKAILDFHLELPWLLIKRTNYHQNVKLHQIGKPNYKGIYRRSIVYEYFMKDRTKFTDLEI